MLVTGTASTSLRLLHVQPHCLHRLDRDFLREENDCEIHAEKAGSLMTRPKYRLYGMLPAMQQSMSVLSQHQI